MKSPKIWSSKQRAVWSQNHVSWRWCCFPLPPASFIAVSWVNSAQPSSIFLLFLCREKELAATGNGWCLYRGMMGRGNGKYYPTLFLLHGPVLFISPYTPSPHPQFNFFFKFFFFTLALFFSSTPPPPPLSSLCSTVSYYNGVFFGRIRLTLPGCLCVELSDFGERGEVPEVFSLMNTLRTEEKREKSTQYSVLEIKRKNKRDGRK